MRRVASANGGERKDFPFIIFHFSFFIECKQELEIQVESGHGSPKQRIVASWLGWRAAPPLRLGVS
ncbi:MAG: hypothetical protein ABJB61_14190 [bacterium]